VVMSKTKRSRRLAQLKAIKQTLRKRLHEKPAATGRWLRRVVEGHINYYGVPFNSRALTRFVEEVKKLWLKSLKRRSQRHRMIWKRFSELCKRWIPAPELSIRIQCTAFTPEPKVRAGCVSRARPDPRGG
jgi:hypothetical protein